MRAGGAATVAARDTDILESRERMRGAARAAGLRGAARCESEEMRYMFRSEVTPERTRIHLW